MRRPLVEQVLGKFAVPVDLLSSAQDEHDSKTNCKKHSMAVFWLLKCRLFMYCFSLSV